MTENPSEKVKDKRFLKQSVYEMEAFVLPNERRRPQKSNAKESSTDLVETAQKLMSAETTDCQRQLVESTEVQSIDSVGTQSIYEMHPFIISGEFAAPRTDLFENLANTDVTADMPVLITDAPKHSQQSVTLDLSTSLPDPRIGAEIGYYHIVDVIGRGNMAVVYKARHMHTNDIVALKTHRSDADNSQKVRFAREIETHARLAHPNIVQYIHSLLGAD